MPEGSARARGFTLVELMVSLAIGTGVALAALSFYSSTLEARRAVETGLVLEEQRWFATQALRRYLAQAGHRPLRLDDVDGPVLPVDSREEAFPAVAGTWGAGRYLRALPGGLAMRFVGASDEDGGADGSLSDCTGQPIGADEIGEMSFTVADGRLLCSVGDVDVTLAGGDGDARVLDLSVRASVDADGDGSADRLEDAGAAMPAEPISLVLALSIESEREPGTDDTVVSVALRN